ncbi:MAG TPA: hypothetical protein ENI62_14150 [Gammaproteobacteria bacterium]|nr:hypothetical protein [Gammaproteobacteria bacterium]
MSQTALLPQFSSIDLTTVESILDHLIAKNRAIISRLGKSESSQWDLVMLPLIEANDALDRFWSPISHLNCVSDSTTLRALYQACHQKLVAFNTEVAQNEALFHTFERASNAPGFARLSISQQQSLLHALRDFHLSGVDLTADNKKTFRKLQETLVNLQTKFSQNILDATSYWYLHVVDSKDLIGLPESVIRQARSKAMEESLSGWVFTLQASSYIPFMQHASSRVLRQKILDTRQQLASLLGYKQYADLALQTRMVEILTKFWAFLMNCCGIPNQ